MLRISLTFIFVYNAYALNLDSIKSNFLSGDYKSAISEGEKILARAKQGADLDEFYYILGLSYLKDGNYLRASDIFEIILKEFKGSRFKEDALMALGDTYILKGDPDKAGSYYKDIIADNPNTKLKAPIFYRLAQVAFKNSDAQQGRLYMDKLKNDFPLSPELKMNKDLGLFKDYFLDYYTVQVGSFTSSRNAHGLCARLTEKGYDAYIEEADVKDGKVYRVKVGKLKERRDAIQLQDKLSSEGYPTKICP